MLGRAGVTIIIRKILSPDSHDLDDHVVESLELVDLRLVASLEDEVQVHAPQRSPVDRMRLRAEQRHCFDNAETHCRFLPVSLSDGLLKWPRYTVGFYR